MSCIGLAIKFKIKQGDALIASHFDVATGKLTTQTLDYSSTSSKLISC